MTQLSITQERLRELFNYDPTTGIVTRKIKIKHYAVGSVVGSSENRGYLHCSVDKKLYKLHRLIWFYVYGSWPVGQIDHINHITFDNRIENLRDVSSAQNHQNRARKTKSSSGYLGVAWHKRNKRWLAHIEINGKAKYLGSFQDLDAAIVARQQAEVLYHPHRADN
jgi:hypothetical protein